MNSAPGRHSRPGSEEARHPGSQTSAPRTQDATAADSRGEGSASEKESGGPRRTPPPPHRMLLSTCELVEASKRCLSVSDMLLFYCVHGFWPVARERPHRPTPIFLNSILHLYGLASIIVLLFRGEIPKNTCQEF